MQLNLFLLLILLLLQACASTGPGMRIMPHTDRFALDGRVSVQHDSESFSGSLHWVADAMQDELLFTDPLGQGIASLVRSSAGVVLTPAGKAPVQAETADELTEKTLGFRLPLAGLRYWVQGHPDPGRPFERHTGNNDGSTQLRQDGWKIDYLQYRENRPRKIYVTRDGLEIRLVIDEWQAN
jgi:outer membrane lipoprotein LolB